ncbi:MAG TPA: HNH endonuclease signature motif containing protein [Aeromicrobium sp.]|nr:HNH endonuclease signature motif containing protein [Aeromicrobium sp.]HKY57632.1 HNH endonuclease signature motif containing protein [Aeromicrobium sp.]
MKSHDGKKAPKGTPTDERLRMHMVVTPGGCWRWTASIGNTGYGRIMLDRKLKYAHRVSYETFVGPIPAGREIDHLCRVRACINPLHLEAVTPQVNVRRGESTGARALRRSLCLYGHPYSEYGTIVAGRRVCTACRDAYSYLYKQVPYAEAMRRKKAGIPVVDLAAHFAEQVVA